MSSTYIKGLVSVIMPTYKRSDMLSRAIESVLSQTYSNLELILVNDNDPGDSYTKDLMQRIEKYQNDKRFIFLNQEAHINGAVARNFGIKNARGEYIAFLDDDDWWQPNKISVQVNTLEKLDNTWGGVSCKYTLFDDYGNIVGKTIKYADGYIYKDILYLLSDVATGTILLRREMFDQTRYFDEKLLRHQDLQLLVDFTKKFKLKEVDQYLHCVDISDTRNRPDPQKLIKYKQAFFMSIADTMDCLRRFERKSVYAIHDFELGYVYFRNRQFRKGLCCSLKVLCHPYALFIAVKKIRIKLMTKQK